MENGPAPSVLNRRALLSLIGLTAGSAVMYQAMTSLGFVAPISRERASTIRGKII
jgi:monoamine oxidase